MATFEVAPLPDGVTQRGSWQVLRNGMQVSSHTKKSAAKRKARQKAKPGDELVIKNTSGTIIDQKTVR